MTLGVNYLSENLVEQLRMVSTATVSTALFKRGLRNQVIQGVGPIGSMKLSMVGFAFTLRYIPAREDLNEASVSLMLTILSARPWKLVLRRGVGDG